MFNDGSAIISSQVHIHPSSAPGGRTPSRRRLHRLFHLSRVAAFVKSHHSLESPLPLRVGLQFPNEFLPLSVDLLGILRDDLKKEPTATRLFVLANEQIHHQVDVIAAQHVPCDAVVQFCNRSMVCLHHYSEFSSELDSHEPPSGDTQSPPPAAAAVSRRPGLTLTTVMPITPKILRIFVGSLRRSEAPEEEEGEEEEKTLKVDALEAFLRKRLSLAERQFVLVLFDPFHHVEIDIVRHRLASSASCRFGRLVPHKTPHERQINGVYFDLSLAELRERRYELLHVGEDNPRLKSTILHLNLLHPPRESKSKTVNLFCRFDAVESLPKFVVGEEPPIGSSLQLARRVVKKHYYLMNLAKVASVFGLLLGRTGTRTGKSDILPEFCRSLLSDCGKKSYVFYMNKLTPPNLANFSEIDMWVLFDCACGQLVDSRELYKPVVTPYDLLGAFSTAIEAQWFDRYILEESELVDLVRSVKDDDASHLGRDPEVDFSLITNAVIRTKKPSEAGNLREDGEQPNQRLWKGIDPSIDVDVGSVRAGLSGIGEEYFYSSREGGRVSVSEEEEEEGGEEVKEDS